MPKPIYLYEIMVPCMWNTGKPIRKKHHQEWDKVVRKTAGGLTIYKPAQGQWVDKQTDSLYAERVIPVRIACTENQMRKIAKFTINHYDQLAVLVYVISEKVFIIKPDEQDRQDQDASAVH